MPSEDDESGGLTLLGLGSARRPPRPPRKEEQRPRGETPREEAMFGAIFYLALGLLWAFVLAWHFTKLRKPVSLAGIPQEVLMFKEVEERVENGDSRVWVSPSAKPLAIRFQKLHSVDGKWAGAMGEVAVRAEGALGGYYRCVPKERRADWGNEMTTGNTAAKFEPECSVELPLTEAHMHKTFNVTARMEVTRPIVTGPGVVTGDVRPGAHYVGFANLSEEVAREFQLYVASADEAERLGLLSYKQKVPLGDWTDFLAGFFIILGFGVATLSWRRYRLLVSAEKPKSPR